MKIHKIPYIFFLLLPFFLQAMQEGGAVIDVAAINNAVLQNALSDTVFRYHVGKKLEATCHAFAEKVAVPVERQLRDIPAYKQKKLQKALRVAQQERYLIFKTSAMALAGLTLCGHQVYTRENGWRNFFLTAGFGYLYFATNLFLRAWNYKNPTMETVFAKLLTRVYQPYDGKKILQKRVNDDPKFWLYLNINYQVGRTNNN